MDKKKKQYPTDSKDLVQLLVLRFPDVCDTQNKDSDFQRGKYAGVVELLRELKQAYDIKKES